MPNSCWGLNMEQIQFFFILFYFIYFAVLYWFCHTSTCIHHGCTHVPHPEPPSHLPPHTIPLDHPSAPAPSFLYPASNLDWQFISYMILYMFQFESILMRWMKLEPIIQSELSQKEGHQHSMLLSHFSHVRLCVTPQTAAHQALPSLRFFRQESWMDCHFLLQCMKVKSESEVSPSCLILSDPTDYSLPGSSVHGIFQARVLEWGAIASPQYTKAYIWNLERW